MANNATRSSLYYDINTPLFLANQGKVYINNNFKAEKIDPSKENTPITPEEAVKKIFEKVQQIRGQEVTSEGWKTLKLNVETYFKGQKVTETSSYAKVLKLIEDKAFESFLFTQKPQTAQISQQKLESILSKKTEELSPSDRKYLRDVATLIEYEKSFFEALFVFNSLQADVVIYEGELKKVGVRVNVTSKKVQSIEYAMSKTASFTAFSFFFRFNIKTSGVNYTLPDKNQLKEIWLLTKSEDKDLAGIAQQYLAYCRYNTATKALSNAFDTLWNPLQDHYFNSVALKSQFADICPDFFSMTEATRTFSIEKHEQKKKGNHQIVSEQDEDYINKMYDKNGPFQKYTDQFPQRQKLYQRCQDKLKATAKKGERLTASSLEGLTKEEPFQSEYFFRPLIEYDKCSMPNEVVQWIEEWEKEPLKEDKKEEKKEAPKRKEKTKKATTSSSSATTPETTPPPLPPPPFTYNDWVNTWFKNPAVNLTAPKFEGLERYHERITRAHIFTPLIDYFVEAIGIPKEDSTQGRKQKKYDTWTIGAEIEDSKGKRRREYVTYGCQPGTNILEHRSFTIKEQEEEIDAFLQKSYREVDWPKLNSKGNQAILQELAPKLMEKYVGSDGSYLAKVEEYQLTFWDAGLKSWIRLMNPRGLEALRSLA